MHLLACACIPASLSAHSIPQTANHEVFCTALDSSPPFVSFNAFGFIMRLFGGFLFAFKCSTAFKDVFELEGAHFGVVWGFLEAFNNALINCKY